MRSKRRREEARPDLPPGTSLHHDSEPVVTDAEGRFERSGIVPTPQPVTIHARHPEFAQATYENVSLRAGTRAQIDLALAQGAAIEGSVTVDGELVSTRLHRRRTRGIRNVTKPSNQMPTADSSMYKITFGLESLV